MQENKPILIVGLGNPGIKYARSRHNAGFMAVRALAGAGAVWKKEKDSLVFAQKTDDRKIIFAMPQTFMNMSGKAVAALVKFYKVPLENLIVIHDDMDLKLGTLREKVGGGSAGHNGIKSIDAWLGSADYRRIRIGIGHPVDFDSKMDAADWVLNRFTDTELLQIRKVISEIKI